MGADVRQARLAFRRWRHVHFHRVESGRLLWRRWQRAHGQTRIIEDVQCHCGIRVARITTLEVSSERSGGDGR